MELINFIKSLIFIFWYMYSSQHFKLRKVTFVTRMLKIFYLLVLFYLVLVGTEFWFAFEYMNNLVHSDEVVIEIVAHGTHPEDYFTESYINLIILYALLVVVFLFLVGAYTYYVLLFRSSMENFHWFLNSYRQTPRSRFIRKY